MSRTAALLLAGTGYLVALLLIPYLGANTSRFYTLLMLIALAFLFGGLGAFLIAFTKPTISDSPEETP